MSQEVVPPYLVAVNTGPFMENPEWFRLVSQFNCLLRDHRVRYYSETLDAAYFGSEQDFEVYKKLISPNDPIDFKMVRNKLVNGKYSRCQELIDDVSLIFENSIQSNVGLIWTIAAHNLLAIWKTLQFDNENKQRIPYALYQLHEKPTETRACKDCGYMCVKSTLSLKNTYDEASEKNSEKHKRKSRKRFQNKCDSCKAFASNFDLYECFNHPKLPKYYCFHCTLPCCRVCWVDRDKLNGNFELAVCLPHFLCFFLFWFQTNCKKSDLYCVFLCDVFGQIVA